MNSIKDFDPSGKRVFLRVDFNIPIIEGKIEYDNRIRAALPTINYLVENNAKIVIGTHAGRPEGKKSEDTSVLPMAKRLARLLNREVLYIDDIVGLKVDEAVNSLKNGQILVLGNLRWSPEEEKNSSDFASKLASYGDIYVNDAFAVSHRANSSVEAITKFLPSYAGFLLESETTTLKLLFDSPVTPFVAIIGGAKIKDKASVIKVLAQKADFVLLGGAVANTFLASQGKNMGDSLIEPEMMDDCKKMLEEYGAKIILPIDEIKDEQLSTFKSMDIGPETVAKYRGILGEANSIFWNGNLGYTEDERFASGTLEIAKIIGECKCATKVAAGGDTVGFIDDHGMSENFSFLSTGGGAALEFMAGEELPGIEALS